MSHREGLLYSAQEMESLGKVEQLIQGPILGKAKIIQQPKFRLLVHLGGEKIMNVITDTHTISNLIGVCYDQFRNINVEETINLQITIEKEN